MRCVRFMIFSRSARAPEQLQVKNLSMSHVSAKTRPARRPIPYSVADSTEESSGGEYSPHFANSSIAPFPPRVGIKEQTDAPHSKAKSIDRHAHSLPSSSDMNGGRTKMNTRRSTP